MRNRKRWTLGMAVLGVAAAMMMTGCGASEQPKKEIQTEAAKTEKETAEDTDAAEKETAKDTDAAEKEAAEDTDATEKETAADTDAAEEAAAGMFADMKTVDLDGNEVDSSVFAENKLTLVNIWNTGCTPCIQEIPELNKLNEDLAEKGVAVKGLLYDLKPGVEEKAKKEAEEILKKAGATYQQLTVSEEMFQCEEITSLVAFPTTYFVDADGRVLDRIEGSADYEIWRALAEEKLEAMESDAQA